MPRRLRRTLFVLALSLVLGLVGQFIFPFGLIPKWASPNCGPEHWRWLGGAFHSQRDVVAYLQQHELELLSGSSTPRLDAFPASWSVSRMQVVIDWQSIAEDIHVKHRPGYIIYVLTYHHPACSGNQSYTFKVTTYGLASLYGCCGV
jgi:hypothetical protein